MVDILRVSLGERAVGSITGLGGDRSIFTFDDDYAADPQRPILSLSFKSAAGHLIEEHKSTQTRLMPFFSNLLPEGPLRNYLAERAGVKPAREFFCSGPWALTCQVRSPSPLRMVSHSRRALGQPVRTLPQDSPTPALLNSISTSPW